MSEIKLPEFYDNYTKSLIEGKAAIFAGAGLSRPAGFVDWKGLLKDIAADLDLDIDRESDLIAIAQFHLNKRKTRSTLNRKLIEEFTEGVKYTENHRLIANLPIRTVWTTNYDPLIEHAFENARKRCEVKFDPMNLAPTKRCVDATIYKMHGDASFPDGAVLTKEDYELYNVNRQAFTQILESDLISKTFLFLGFSFTDPNIDYVLGRIRVLVGTGRDHYCIMRREPKQKGLKRKKLAHQEYAQRKQRLRIDDLGRYNIRTILVNEYSEITDILKELNRRIHLNDVFVSGSAVDYEPRGRESIEQLSGLIGHVLINRGYNLISGFGLGIGSFVIVGAMEAAYSDDEADADQRLILRPFPQGDAPSGMTTQQFWEKYRRDMLAKAGFAIFLCGNKQDDKGDAILANGVMQEFEIAKELGVYPIPVGATGHAAREIWNTVNTNLAEYFPGFDVKTNFHIIGNEKKTNKEIVEAIFAIIKRVKQ